MNRQDFRMAQIAIKFLSGLKGYAGTVVQYVNYCIKGMVMHWYLSVSFLSAIVLYKLLNTPVIQEILADFGASFARGARSISAIVDNCVPLLPKFSEVFQCINKS